MEDGCFFGAPAVLDAVLHSVFQERYAELYSKVGALRLPYHAQELQFVAALNMSGVQRVHPCNADTVSLAALQMLGVNS